MNISVQPVASLGGAVSRPMAAVRSSYGQPIIQAVAWFNFVLCLVNTQHWAAVSPAQIALIQLLLLGAAVFVGRVHISPTLLAYASVAVGAIVALKLVNPGLDLKILFDLAVGPGFLLLGLQSTVPQGHAILRNLLICVVAIGLVEMAFTTFYEKYVDIWSYYVNKGAVSADTTNFTGTSFFTNGERSEQAGRMLLGGLLGSHRASSIFLESVSMGNFPIVCLAWLLSVRLPRLGLTLVLFGLTIACIILPDSRFAAACCVIMVALRVTGLHRSALFAAILPVAVMGLMWLAGSIVLNPDEYPHLLSDDMSGRLLFSGKLLAYWDWSNWLAFTPSPVYVQDTGYAYVVSNVGLPVALLIWLGFAFSPVRTPEAAAMRGMIAVYYSASLAINSSVFSIKTAALLWFLYGAAQMAATASARTPALRPAVA